MNFKYAKGSMLLLLLLSGWFSTPAAAQKLPTLQDALDGLAKLSFGRDSKLTIGDSVDVVDPSTPKERCIAFDAAQLKADTSGAINSNISFRLVRDLDQFENTFKFSYSVEAAASVNFAKIISGQSSLSSFGSFENYLRRDKESLLLVIEATALHGRDFVHDYDLKQDYKELVKAGNYEEFRKRCGTNFVRGWNRVSSISAIVEISNLDQEGKIAISNTMTGVLGASVSAGDLLGGSAKTTISNTLSDTLRLAEKLGKVNATVEAVGGLGIPSITAIVNSGNLSDPQVMQNLLTAIAQKASDFTYQNSSPDEFILVPYPQLDVTKVKFNGANFEKLGKIYKALLRVDQRAALYDDYRQRDQRLWDQYFRTVAESIKALRIDLVEAYRACRNDGNCDADIPGELDGLILGDLLADGSLQARCFYSYKYEDAAGGQVVATLNYLSSIAVVWKGKLNFARQVDAESAEALMIDPSFTLKNLQFDPTARQNVRTTESEDQDELFLDVYRESIVPASITASGELDLNALRDIRKRVAQSVFVMRYQTVNGISIDETLGRPEMRDCPVYR